MRLTITATLACAALLLAGCESIDEMFPGSSSDSNDAPVSDTNPGGTGPGGAGTPANGNGTPQTIDHIVWLHHNVSGWAQTANLSSVRISGGTITLKYDKANVWPGVEHAGAFVNANPWVFVYRDGRWYAATWEWLRVGQTSKAVSSVHGSHIKESPLGSFVPQSGETYGFMVSGLARDSRRNVEERSNIVAVRWP